MLNKVFKILKEPRYDFHILESLVYIFQVPRLSDRLFKSSLSLTIPRLVPLWFIIMSLVFFHLREALFSGFFQFQGYSVDGQKNSKYRDVAPIKANITASKLPAFPFYQHQR